MFIKNLNALNIKNPDLAKRLKGFSFEDAQKNISVLQAQSGDLIIAYNGQPLDDMVNPIEKTKNIWDSLVKTKFSKNDIVLVFGLGLGYLFKRTYVSSSSRIVIYEPKIEILRFVLEYVDFSEQFNDRRIFITDKESDCLDYLSEKYISNDKIEVVYSDIYLNLFSDSLLSLSKKIIQICESKKADISTINTLSKTWTLNSIENAKLMANSRPLSVLKNVFKGKTALILGAGPSLKNNIELIKQNRDKYVVFVVNKVLDFVIDNGIEPDFLVAADAKWLMYTMRVVPDVFEKINLIATTKVDSFVYNQNYNSIFNYYLKNDLFYQELSVKFPEEIALFETEGTAVSQCYYSALEMGFSKIIFCGLDLAIRQNEAYASGIKTTVDHGVMVIGPERHGFKKNITEVKSFSGDMVQTRDDYAMFARQLESAFAKNKAVKLYNTTDFGAYIEGMIYEPFCNIVKNIEPMNIDVNSEINKLYSLSQDRWQEIYSAQLEILKKQKEDMSIIGLSIEAWLKKNKTKIESVDKDKINQQIIEELKTARSEEISIIKHVLDNTILGSYFQSEFFEYSQLNSEDSDIVEARLYSLSLFEKITQVIPSLMGN